MWRNRLNFNTLQSSVVLPPLLQYSKTRYTVFRQTKWLSASCHRGVPGPCRIMLSMTHRRLLRSAMGHSSFARQPTARNSASFMLLFTSQNLHTENVAPGNPSTPHTHLHPTAAAACLWLPLLLALGLDLAPFPCCSCHVAETIRPGERSCWSHGVRKIITICNVATGYCSHEQWLRLAAEPAKDAAPNKGQHILLEIRSHA